MSGARRPSNDSLESRIAEIERKKDYIRLHTHNGFGASNTFIPRFTTTVEAQTGTDFAYTDSASAGASITILKAGKYCFAWSVDLNQTTATMSYGFTKNGTNLSGSVGSSPMSEILGYDGDRADGSGSASKFAGITVSVQLQPGDIVRPHAGITLAITGASILAVARVD